MISQALPEPSDWSRRIENQQCNLSEPLAIRERRGLFSLQCTNSSSFSSDDVNVTGEGEEERLLSIEEVVQALDGDTRTALPAYVAKSSQEVSLTVDSVELTLRKDTLALSVDILTCLMMPFDVTAGATATAPTATAAAAAAAGECQSCDETILNKTPPLTNEDHHRYDLGSEDVVVQIDNGKGMPPPSLSAALSDSMSSGCGYFGRLPMRCGDFDRSCLRNKIVGR